MKQKILIVSHCILNTASKVIMYEQEEIDAEENLRKKLLNKIINNGIQVIQLPCPEFTLYGSRRWGHVSDQFNNIFFKNHCRLILTPIVDQILEYYHNPKRFEIIGIIGIDGSPSCGVDYTCTSEKWYGCITGRDEDIMEIINNVEICNLEGIMIKVLKELLNERKIVNIPIVGLFSKEPEKCLNLLGN